MECFRVLPLTLLNGLDLDLCSGELVDRDCRDSVLGLFADTLELILDSSEL